MTTLPEKGTKRLGVERNRNVITLHGVEGSDKSSRETYTECPRRNVPDFGRVFLMLKYTDKTQNTYVQS